MFGEQGLQEDAEDIVVGARALRYTLHTRQVPSLRPHHLEGSARQGGGFQAVLHASDRGDPIKHNN